MIGNTAKSVIFEVLLAPMGVEEEYVFPFTDVKESDWFYNAVAGAHQMGLVNGKTETEYKPNDNMTYAEALKLAACMHQSYTEGKVTLTNGEAIWYQPYADYCVEKGIISGDISYNAMVTRIGYMDIFSKALPDEALKEINIIPNNSIPDVPASMGKSEGVYKLYRAGILAGVDTKHNCNPESNIKRSEVAAVLSRMMDATKRVSFDTIATAPIEEVPMQKFEIPEKKQWEGYTFGKEGDKTVAEQRAEILEGMNLILKSFGDSFSKMDVKEIEALGKTFDPNLHYAVMHVEDDAYGENEVVEVLQKGYICGDKVIRYAMVKVAN
jgi:hypothetical protein